MEQTNRITAIRAREVIDCRGLPTVQVDLVLDDATFGRADVPAGRSTGSYEAFEMRDGGSRFGGFGVLGAIKNVVGPIAEHLIGSSVTSQRDLDQRLIDLDGTPNKSRMGANAILGVSLAYARAAAVKRRVPLYQSISLNAHILPVPQFNLINGGKHASNDLDFQEISIVPVGAASFLEAVQVATEVNLKLAEILTRKFDKFAINIGDEGGYVPPVTRADEALGYLHEAVDQAGYSDIMEYALDCAATHLYNAATKTYHVGGKDYDVAGMSDMYEGLVKDYGVTSIEDPLDEDAVEETAALTKLLGIQIVGDDLFTTNLTRIKTGIAAGAANALLWKMNQIGTLSESLDAAALAMRNGYGVVVSERSGETEDPIIADMVVGMNAGQIKTGAPVRGERTAKYNRLIVIEEELGSQAVYSGRNYRRAV